MEEKQRQRARAALDAMFSPFIYDWLARQAVLAPEHQQFLEYALRRYEEFAADAREDEEARAGVAHLKVCEVHRVGVTVLVDTDRGAGLGHGGSLRWVRDSAVSCQHFTQLAGAPPLHPQKSP